MDKLQAILSLTGTALGLTITTLTFVIKFCKSMRAKKVIENTLKISNAILPYVEQAELFLNYSGREKKEYVITKANQFAIENNIDFDEEAIGIKIEELVELTKNVNSKGGSLISGKALK